MACVSMHDFSLGSGRRGRCRRRVLQGRLRKAGHVGEVARLGRFGPQARSDVAFEVPSESNAIVVHSAS